MPEFSDRFERLLADMGSTPYKFSKETGVSEAVISNIRNRKSLPSFGFLQKILCRYTAINANWLITGYGEMYADTVPMDTFTGDAQNDLVATQREAIASLKENNVLKDEKIHALLAEIRALKSGRISGRRLAARGKKKSAL